MTNLLLDLLKAGAPSRIVNVAGEYHKKAKIDFNDLQWERSYDGMAAANQVQLLRILFTYELARRLEGTGVTVNCLHPGAVKTNILEGQP